MGRGNICIGLTKGADDVQCGKNAAVIIEPADGRRRLRSTNIDTYKHSSLPS